MREVELLAPANDLECGVAAIDCGADAVYVGAPQFGARESAGNALEDIAELARHAHRYWARVYVTVNTLLHDDEIPQALELISQLQGTGVDALIIQDTALLECDLPPLPLIASTQMHNSTPERVAFLEQAGISRAILARELDLEQIREIRGRTGLELEFFVHGALCVSYSGQCYLSYALGGRSGNRGQCAQPCRKPYTLVDARGKTLATSKHLLSLRDLNLSGHLRDLLDAGVTSFKIEGRLKDRAYVSNLVAFYRRKLDEALAGTGLRRSSSGASRIDFRPDPSKTFNRGATTYFLHGRSERIGSIDTPKMVGEPIGRAVALGRGEVTLDSDMPMHPGDGICFFDRSGGLRGTVVNGVRGRTIVLDKPDGIEKGTLIHRNHDHEFLTHLARARAERRISVMMTLTETGEGVAVTAVDEDGVRAELALPCEKAPAHRPGSALESITKQLAKSGGTEFECVDVRVDMPEAPFLPISTLNALRRGVLDGLASARARSQPRLTAGSARSDAPCPTNTLSFEGNVLNRRAEAFYRRHGVTSIEPAAESGLDLRGRRVMACRYCVRHQLGMCGGSAARPQEPLYLIDGEGRRLELRFDCARCEMEIYLERGGQ